MRPRTPAPSLLLTALLLATPGCDDPVASTGGEDPRELACIAPTAGMVVTADTVLCPGTFPMSVPAGQAAISIVADGVTLTCLGTRISGVGPVGPVASPNVGIRVDGHDGVTVDGCAADSFRYGLVARDANKLVLRGLDLDDNFTDPTAGWVQDTVQGGGIRLERVVDGLVQGSTFARNWNGIELRDSEEVLVQDNEAAHCSNTAATLVGADHNTLVGNDFSWAIRGDDLAYPDNWYGVDTRDSAGIIVDAGSTDNTVKDNDLSFGGDGIFVRAIIGVCARGNRFIANDTSYSPHNAIESWCDDNLFADNDASESHYGIWLGGSDNAVVRGNTVVGSKVDGISMQIGEGRHTLIDGNTITGSGRAGILLTGREYQAGDDLETHWAPELANSSHTLIQRNYLADNLEYDIFTTSTRGIVTASNCGEIDWTGPDIVFYSESEVALNVPGCAGPGGAKPPTVAVVDPGPVSLGVPVQLSTTHVDAQKVPTRRYNWVVQPGGERFLAGALPDLVYGASATYHAGALVTFTRPGAYDVDVIAVDGGLGGMAHRAVNVPPGGARIGQTAGAWQYACTSDAGCVTSLSDVPDGVEGDAVEVVSDAPFGLVLRTSAAGAFDPVAAEPTALGFFVRASNPNPRGWQGANPIVKLVGGAGSITYTPARSLLPTAPGDWAFIEVPLAGGAGWQVTHAGGTLADVDHVELVVDTWGDGAFELTIDALSVY